MKSVIQAQAIRNIIKKKKKREKLCNNKLLKQQQWKGIEDEIEMKKHVDNKCNIGHVVIKKQT